MLWSQGLRSIRLPEASFTPVSEGCASRSLWSQAKPSLCSLYPASGGLGRAPKVPSVVAGELQRASGRLSLGWSKADIWLGRTRLAEPSQGLELGQGISVGFPEHLGPPWEQRQAHRNRHRGQGWGGSSFGTNHKETCFLGLLSGWENAWQKKERRIPLRCDFALERLLLYSCQEPKEKFSLSEKIGSAVTCWHCLCFVKHRWKICGHFCWKSIEGVLCCPLGPLVSD